MPHSSPAGNTTNLSTTRSPATVAAGSASKPPRTRRRFWWLLAGTLVVCALFYPPPWHALLRGVLVRMAARHGGDLTISRIEGGPFDPVHLYGLHWRQQGLPERTTDSGTDLRITHAELTFTFRLPWRQQATPSDVQCVVLDGVSGRWDFATVPDGPSGHDSSTLGRWLNRLSARLIPAEFFLRGDDLTFQRHRYRLRVRGLRLSGVRNGLGTLLAREVEIAGPGFENTLFGRHSETLWQGNRLSLNGLELGPGVRLTSATVDGTQLKRQRLDWEGTLTAMGGEIRGQGTINFVHPRLALEVAGSLHRLPMAPLARLLGLASAAGGQVDQGSFSFHGDPENWTAAEMWLTAQATDFRWGERDWQNLELRATVLHQRIQVHRLELQQSRNRVSLTGECPLFSPGQAAGWWWEKGIFCNVDARLDDLHALGQLFGARLPEVDGRMSVNGTLETAPGRPGINGYLSVEGSSLTIRGAPLDYLHSTLLFRGDVLNVADVQATRGEDYFAGRGLVNLAGVPGYLGELRVSMADPGLYVLALAGIGEPPAGPTADGLCTPVRLEGVFYGPDATGKTDFLTFGSMQYPGLPTTVGGDWWSDPWLEVSSFSVGTLPAAMWWQF